MPPRTAKRDVLTSIWIVVLVCLLFGAWKFFAYAHLYTGTAFNPESVRGEVPTYFYLDWRGDLATDKAVQKAMSPDSILSGRGDVLFEGVPRHDPLRVIQASLGLHDRLLDRWTPEGERLLRKQIDWLCDEAAVVLPSGIRVWPQFYTFERYGLVGPWISALTQGQAISLLVRAASFTGDSAYAAQAHQAVRAFTEPGLPIVWRGANGEIFFEEYPCDPPSHVLNGCLLAWLGLWDWARYSGDAQVRALCLGSLNHVRQRVPAYELGDWTRYDVHQERPTSPVYQEIHAALAAALFAITQDAFWDERAGRWRAAAEDPLARSAVFFRVLKAKVKAKFGGGQPRPRGLGLTRGEL